VALTKAAGDIFTNSPQQKHNECPWWNKDVKDKHKAARQAYFYWIEFKPKGGPLFDIMKESKK